MIRWKRQQQRSIQERLVVMAVYFMRSFTKDTNNGWNRNDSLVHILNKKVESAEEIFKGTERSTDWSAGEACLLRAAIWSDGALLVAAMSSCGFLRTGRLLMSVVVTKPSFFFSFFSSFLPVFPLF